MENLFGVMVDFIKVNGKIILCMEEVILNGQTDKNLKVNMKTIRNKVMENCNLRME